jgi:hypothetical protein
MSSFIRIPILAVLVGAGFLANTSSAQAQLYGGFVPFNPRGYQVIPGSFFNPLPPLQPLQPLPGVNAFNPLMFNPFHQPYNPGIQSSVTYYGLNRLYSGQRYSSAPSYHAPTSLYPSTYSVMSTGSKESPLLNYGRAQEEVKKANGTYRGTTRSEVRTKPKPAAPDPQAVLAEALTVNDPARLASGDVLNRILAAVVDARGKGRKGEAAFLTPRMLAEYRFAGGANATALNLLAAGRKWDPPEVFQTGGALGRIGTDLEGRFNTATALPLAGLPPDRVKVDALEAGMRQARVALDAVIDDLEFDEAAAARGFLNQIDDVITVLNTPASTGLIDPRWAAEGVGLTEFVDHMNRYKVRFGPAGDGDVNAYVTMHRGLSAYLYALGGKAEAAK